MSLSRPARFCPYCAQRLIRRDDHGVQRPTCPSCGFIAYRNPSPAVAVILPRDDGLVLVRRRYEPYAGAWSLPSGFMEYGEEPTETARRETREETGLEIEVGALIGAYRGTDDPRVRVVLLVYQARVSGGRMRAGDDASEIGIFELDALPPDMAFRAHRTAIRDYRRIKSAQTRIAARTKPALHAGGTHARRRSGAHARRSSRTT